MAHPDRFLLHLPRFSLNQPLFLLTVFPPHRRRAPGAFNRRTGDSSRVSHGVSALGAPTDGRSALTASTPDVRGEGSSQPYQPLFLVAEHGNTSFQANGTRGTGDKSPVPLGAATRCP